MLNKLFIVVFAIIIVADTPQFKPSIHYSASSNWINDPNGLVYYQGEYHLFYQYNPYGNQWGNMSWGHAVSTDLINWEELEVAIPYQNNIMAFSGSAVIDWENSSGFGENNNPPMVAVYTGYNPNTRIQDQRIAYSLDNGRTFTEYSQNPVIDLQSTEFRDPKVFWHADSQKWVMVVALATERKISFYTSNNLKDWMHTQDFSPFGDISGVWECPDLFQLDVKDSTEKKWMLMVSMAPGKAQYFIGEFDGVNFVLDEESLAETDNLITNFEQNNYAGWIKSGTAFGTEPALGTLQNQQLVSGYLGNGLVNTFLNGDGTTGSLTSPDFIIERDFLNFLVGGGNHTNDTYVSLEIEGTEVYRISGKNSEQMEWVSWDTTAYIGQNGRLKIIDTATGGWGHILADHFVQSNTAKENYGPNFVDYGMDFYAAQSFSDIPDQDNRRIWLAWMANWDYAGVLPTSPWRGSMTIPRKLSLIKINDRYRLSQQPVDELLKMREDKTTLTDFNIEDLNSFFQGKNHDVYELNLELDISNTEIFEINIFTSENNESKLTINRVSNTISFDRSNSGLLVDNNTFSQIQEVYFEPSNFLDITLIADKSSIEIFAQNGTIVLSNVVFPNGNGLNFKDFTGSTHIIKAVYSEINPSLSSNPIEKNVLVFPTLIQSDTSHLNVSLKESNVDDISIFDINGKRLAKISTNGTNGNLIRISAEYFTQPGVYILKVRSKTNFYTQKIVKL